MAFYQGEIVVASLRCNVAHFWVGTRPSSLDRSAGGLGSEGICQIV